MSTKGISAGGLRLAYDPVLGVWGTDIDLGPAGSGSVSFSDVTVDVDLLDGRIVGVFIDRVPWSAAAAAVLEAIVGTDTPSLGEPSRPLVVNPQPAGARVRRLLAQLGRLRGRWYLDHPAGPARSGLWAAEAVELAGELARADGRLVLDMAADARAAANLLLTSNLLHRLEQLSASDRERLLPRFQRMVLAVAQHPANVEHRQTLRSVAVMIAQAGTDADLVAFELLGPLGGAAKDPAIGSVLTRGGPNTSAGSGPSRRRPSVPGAATERPEGFELDLTRIRRGLFDPQATLKITFASGDSFADAEARVALVGPLRAQDVLFVRAVTCPADAEPQVLGFGRLVPNGTAELVARLPLPPNLEAFPPYYVEVVTRPDEPLFTCEEHELNVDADTVAEMLMQEGLCAVGRADTTWAADLYRRAQNLYQQMGDALNAAYAARAAATIPQQLADRFLAETCGDILELSERETDEPEAQPGLTPRRDETGTESPE